MFKINTNFQNVSESYLFSTIAKRVDEYRQRHPGADLIRLGIGDVTLPLCRSIVDELIKASEEQADAATFVGYGPEQGHRFLIEKIIKSDYQVRGVELSVDEVFISDGAKSDIGNIGDILSADNIVAITDPVYPVYLDTNIMSGRKIHLLPCTEERGFKPEIPADFIPDIIYLCSPNNPTGAALTKAELTSWVDFALAHGALILFDSAYEAYICEPDIPHSIYEIEGAKKCAIEFRSFSKTAGFTGLRCGYTIVPRELCSAGVSLNNLWRRRQSTKFNGASYVVQRAASAVYSPIGKSEVKANIDYYKANASILRHCFQSIGLQAYGGENSPYIWVKTPGGQSSWEFFDFLLDNAAIVSTPGVGFGKCGEGFIRFTAFNSTEAIKAATDRIFKLNINH